MLTSSHYIDKVLVPPEDRVDRLLDELPQAALAALDPDENHPFAVVVARPLHAGSGDKDDDDRHLMVVCMESWFLAEQQALATFFGQSFRSGTLPANRQVEQVSKTDVFDGLKNATRHTQKGTYDKGRDSCRILALIDPSKVRKASPYAERLLSHLNEVL